MPVPRGAGEWLALLAGIRWSIATTRIRTRSTQGPVAAAFVFASGAVAGRCCWHRSSSPFQRASRGPACFRRSGGRRLRGISWGASVAAFVWSAARVDPTRVGLLLMVEVLGGAVSAALLAGARLAPWEIVGGALVLCASILEVGPMPGRCDRRSPS